MVKSCKDKFLRAIYGFICDQETGSQHLVHNLFVCFVLCLHKTQEEVLKTYRRTSGFLNAHLSLVDFPIGDHGHVKRIVKIKLK